MVHNLGTVPGERKGEIIFLGTGTSEGIPRVSCLTKEDVTCDVCAKSMLPNNKNRRRNTSIIIRYPHPDGRDRFILVDVGKFFWHSALEWMVKYKIPRIDAIVITHDHFDAVGGLDDLRDWTRTNSKPMPIYLRESDHNSLKTMFPYLTKVPAVPYANLPVSQTEGSDPDQLGVPPAERPGALARLVPDLNYVIIDSNKPFKVEGLEFTPLPVLHGGDYVCLGFKFGVENTVAYISDTNEIPESTRNLVKGVDLLVLDCLYIDSNFSHLSYSQSLDETRKIGAKETLYIGMNHVLEHDATNEKLKEEGLSAQLAYDGMRVPLYL